MDDRTLHMLKSRPSMSSTIPSVSAPQSAMDVAKCLVKIANADDKIVGTDLSGNPVKEGITHLKLQKMLYFAQATHLAIFDRPLFEDEIQAWSLGPVVPSVYRVFKDSENQPIDPNAGECNNPEVEKFLNVIWQLFGKYSASELVDMTHRHKPWLSVYKEDVQNIPISQEAIKAYYKESFASPVNA